MKLWVVRFWCSCQELACIFYSSIEKVTALGCGVILFLCKIDQSLIRVSKIICVFWLVVSEFHASFNITSLLCCVKVSSLHHCWLFLVLESLFNLSFLNNGFRYLWGLVYRIYCKLCIYCSWQYCLTSDAALLSVSADI